MAYTTKNIPDEFQIGRSYMYCIVHGPDGSVKKYAEEMDRVIAFTRRGAKDFDVLAPGDIRGYVERWSGDDTEARRQLMQDIFDWFASFHGTSYKYHH